MMFYSKDPNYNRIWAVNMEQRRLLFNDRAYRKMHHEYWGISNGPFTPEEKQELAEIDAIRRRELDEYTAHEDFDPALAKELRKSFRKYIREALKKGTWREQLEAKEKSHQY